MFSLGTQGEGVWEGPRAGASDHPVWEGRPAPEALLCTLPPTRAPPRPPSGTQRTRCGCLSAGRHPTLPGPWRQSLQIGTCVSKSSQRAPRTSRPGLQAGTPRGRQRTPAHRERLGGVSSPAPSARCPDVPDTACPSPPSRSSVAARCCQRCELPASCSERDLGWLSDAPPSTRHPRGAPCLPPEDASSPEARGSSAAAGLRAGGGGSRHPSQPCPCSQ